MYPFHYSVSLRIHHPTINPHLISQQLQREPDRQWQQGHQRRTPKGEILKGQYKTSYWLHCIAEQLDDDDYCLDYFLEDTTEKLKPHQEFFAQIRQEGGRIEYFIGVFLEQDNSGIVIECELMQQIAELGIDLLWDIYGPE